MLVGKIMKLINRVENPEELREFCRSVKSKLTKDTSNYATQRYRLWLFHSVDFRTNKVSEGYYSDRLYKFSQKIYPGCNIGLLTFAGSLENGKISDGRISLHRDHSYASPLAISVNLGEAIFTLDGKSYLLKDGDICQFNCKLPHGVKQILSPERFSLIFWKLNSFKGFYPLS